MKSINVQRPMRGLTWKEDIHRSMLLKEKENGNAYFPIISTVE